MKISGFYEVIIPQARDEKIQDGMWLNRKDFWAIVMFHMSSRRFHLSQSQKEKVRGG